MAAFDYGAEAELFTTRRWKSVRRSFAYRRFGNAAESANCTTAPNIRCPARRPPDQPSRGRRPAVSKERSVDENTHERQNRGLQSSVFAEGGRSCVAGWRLSGLDRRGTDRGTILSGVPPGFDHDLPPG